MTIKEIYKKQGGLSLLKQYWRGGALFTGIIEFIILGRSRTALEILRNATSYKIKQKLEKKYANKLIDIENRYENKDEYFERKIWICWFQGMEVAPDIVKACFFSIKKNIVDREVVLITEQNYRNYVTFPKKIQTKIDQGIISGAHKSDLLRLELLQNYGGTWIDATVFCSTSEIPRYMLDDNLFLFQCLKPGRDGQVSVISNWFITAKPNHKLIFMMRELLYDYWENNDNVIDYFIFHDFFQILIERYPEEWNKVIPVCNSTPHIILLRLNDTFDKKTWEAVSNQSPFHKLTWKLNIDIEEHKSYYNYIIKLGEEYGKGISDSSSI